MPLQILTLKLDGITAGDYLTCAPPPVLVGASAALEQQRPDGADVDQLRTAA
jgi:hypothetical protein